jgi:hypothetical protein
MAFPGISRASDIARQAQTLALLHDMGRFVCGQMQ